MMVGEATVRVFKRTRTRQTRNLADNYGLMVGPRGGEGSRRVRAEPPQPREGPWMQEQSVTILFY